MKYAPLLLLIAGSLASAQTTAVVSRQVTVQIGPATAIADIYPPPPPGPPISVEAGTDLKLLAVAPGSTYGPVQWYKNGNQLAETGGTLEITSTSASDSGVYTCTVVSDTKGDTTFSDGAAIFVATNATQRLLNFSTLATIGTSQPTATAGFVVEPGPGLSPVLVRAVGPTLESFGVAGFLALPSLELLDSQGNVVSPYITLIGGSGAASSVAIAAGYEVGAFQLLTGSADAAQLYYLSPGAYTARVGSVDGSGGTVLVEVYEVPF